MEGPRQEIEVGAAVNFENRQGRPRVDRRIDSAKVPFVGGQFPTRMHVPFAENEEELMLRRGRVDMRQGDAVKREVPCGEPRVLPLVGHDEDVVTVQMPPILVASAQAVGRRRRLSRVAVEPPLEIKVIKLLAPNQSGERLTHDR